MLLEADNNVQYIGPILKVTKGTKKNNKVNNTIQITSSVGVFVLSLDKISLANLNDALDKRKFAKGTSVQTTANYISSVLNLTKQVKKNALQYLDMEAKEADTSASDSFEEEEEEEKNESSEEEDLNDDDLTKILISLLLHALHLYRVKKRSQTRRKRKH